MAEWGMDRRTWINHFIHLFLPDVVIETSSGPFAYDTHRAYKGYLEGENSLQVIFISFKSDTTRLQIVI